MEDSQEVNMKIKKLLVVAPHPDDETLGCGGTILRYKEQGNSIHWLIFTGNNKELGFSNDRIQSRSQEIKKVSAMYSFDSVNQLEFATATLDFLPMQELVQKTGNIIEKIKPEEIYLPFPGDAHTDHKIVFQTVSACSKWFRYNFIRRILAYETLSETDFNLNPLINSFRPNVFIDISNYLQKKIEIMKIYQSEISDFPFPRSEKAIRSLAELRGASAGCKAAEAFILLKEIV